MIRIIAAGVILAMSVMALRADRADRRETIEIAKEAADQGNFDEAYKIILPLAEAGDAELQFQISILLSAHVINSVPNDRQQRLAILWLRKSANLGWRRAIDRLADAYKWGWMGLPLDSELANCYREAVASPSGVAKCAGLEQAKGYIDR